MDDVREVTETEYQEACRQARFRVLFDRDPRVRAARKAYKKAVAETRRRAHRLGVVAHRCALAAGQGRRNPRRHD